MTDQNLGLPATADIAKAQAKRLRSALPTNLNIGHSQALELIARVHGEQSWGRLNSLISTSAKVGFAATDIAEPTKSGRGDELPAHHVEQRALQALWRGLERATETSVGPKTVAKAKELWKAEIIELISLEEWLDTLDVVLGGMIFDMRVENLLKMSQVETVSRFDRPKAREKTVYGTSGLRPAAFAAVLIWLERLGFDTHPEAFYEPIIEKIKRARYLDENELTCFWHARERGRFKTSEHFVDAQTKISNVERTVMKGRTGLTIEVNRSTDPLGLIETLRIYRA